MTDKDLDVLVSIINHGNISVKIVLNTVQAISGPRRPKAYSVSVNFINTDEPQSLMIYYCSDIDLNSGTRNITLTLNCNIQVQELSTFNISASNEAGDALIFENGKLSEFDYKGIEIEGHKG